MKRRIGKTDIEVFAIGLGGMSIQGRPDEVQGIATIHAVPAVPGGRGDPLSAVVVHTRGRVSCS
jgi:hypothetical protein